MTTDSASSRYSCTEFTGPKNQSSQSNISFYEVFRWTEYMEHFDCFILNTRINSKFTECSVCRVCWKASDMCS